MFQCSGYLCSFSVLSEHYSEDRGQTGWSDLISYVTARCCLFGGFEALCTHLLAVFSPTHQWAGLMELIAIQDVMFGTRFHFGVLYLRELSHCGWFRSRKITAQRLKYLTHSRAKLSSLQANMERFFIHFMEPNHWASIFFFFFAFTFIWYCCYHMFKFPLTS